MLLGIAVVVFGTLLAAFGLSARATSNSGGAFAVMGAVRGIVGLAIAFLGRAEKAGRPVPMPPRP
ncbi:MAG: hypothetical protein WC985_00595 [Thermoplasmata archaeon]